MMARRFQKHHPFSDAKARNPKTRKPLERVTNPVRRNGVYWRRRNVGGSLLAARGGDPKAGLGDVADHIKRSLAALEDDDIQRSLAGLPEPGTLTTMETVDSVPRAQWRYSLTRLHASGGIGRIWVAHDSEFGRDVALKELRPEPAGQATHTARFLQEARITGQLEHPGIVPVYELAFRPDDRHPFTRCAS